MRLMFIVLLIVVIACVEQDRSEVHVIKIQESHLDSIQNVSDSVVIERPNGSLYDTVETYFRDDREIAKRILKDSMGNVRTIIDLKNGKYLKSKHYYANGQLKGNLSYSHDGVLNGPAIYYHKNGRVKAKGTFQGNKRVGNWKHYNKDGKLNVIYQYNERGNRIDSTVN